jgi:hypothetical protein
VTLRVDGQALTQPLVVVADPRVPVDSDALAQSLAATRRVRELLARHYDSAAEFDYVQERTEELRKESSASPAVIAALDTFEASVKPLHAGVGDLPGNVDLANIGSQLRSLASDIEDSDRAPTESQLRALTQCAERLDRAIAAWGEARKRDLPRLNRSLKAAGVAPIEIPPVDRIRLSGPSESVEMP